MSKDYAVFALILVVFYALLEIWMWRYRKSAGISKEEKEAAMGGVPVLMIMVLILLISVGAYISGIAGQKQKSRLERIVQGIAPTLAYELSERGHERLSLRTPPDDHLYLTLIGSMVKWMKLNPEIQSIYTMRKKDNGSIVFILGPETDYDHNGVIEGDEEARVPIGEKYTETVPELLEAFHGKPTMQREATLDKWGYSISAFVPVFNRSGIQEAVLGVDFDGRSWIQRVRLARLNVVAVVFVLFILTSSTYLIVFRYRMEEIRTARHNAELAASKEEAERANSAKSAFLSRMSHDLRTPLNAISGFAQLLDRDPSLSERHKFMVKEIEGACDHLTGLINEVLDLARIEAGKISLSFEFVPVELALQSLSLIKHAAVQRNISIVKQSEGCEDYLLHADTVRLKEVLLNLLSNAVKYNREDGTITVSCKLVEDGNMRISVEDTGQGISEAELPSVFDPFTRLKEHHAVEGTGIGLSITKKFVELMGGRIGVESTRGKGSCFWIELPCVRKGQIPLQDACRKDALGAESTGAMRRILYVEDTPANINLMSHILCNLPGIALQVAPTGEKAVETAKAECPDLILLDINLPGIDGFEVLKQLRSCKSTESIPAVAISSNARPEDMVKAREAGFEAFITKPVGVDDLLRVVENLLSERANTGLSSGT